MFYPKPRLFRLVLAAVTTGAIAGPLASPAPAQTYNAVCVLVDSQGNALDLSRLCGSQSPSQPASRSKAVEARPANLRLPTSGQLPDYGVIFLNPVSAEPIHLGYRQHYLAASLGNASSAAVNDLRLYYDILVSVDGEYAAIGKGSKLLQTEDFGAGDRLAFQLSRMDVMDQVIPAFRDTPDISLRVTALGWTEADGSRNSFAPDSYRLAKGIGRCYFPWEQDSLGRGCGARAISRRASPPAIANRPSSPSSSQ